MSLAEAAAAASAAEATQSSSNYSVKDDVQRLLEGLSSTMSAMQRAVDSEREIAEMRAERERLRQGSGVGGGGEETELHHALMPEPRAINYRPCCVLRG